MNYSDWLNGNWRYGPPKQPIDQPLFRDERGLVTPIDLVDGSSKEHLRIISACHGVSEDAMLRESVERLCKRGTWCKDFDCFSFWSWGGLRYMLVMMPDGIRAWLVTKTRWDQTQEEIEAITRWRWWVNVI